MRVLRTGLVALGVVTASWVLGAAPAFASGPPVPAGCSFGQPPGVLSCSVSTNQTLTGGPFTTDEVSASTVFGDFTGTQICTEVDGLPSQGVYTFIVMNNVTVTGVVTTTTTTQSHGLHGKVFGTSSSTSSSVTGVAFDSIGCG